MANLPLWLVGFKSRLVDHLVRPATSFGRRPTADLAGCLLLFAGVDDQDGRFTVIRSNACQHIKSLAIDLGDHPPRRAHQRLKTLQHVIGQSWMGSRRQRRSVKRAGASFRRSLLDGFDGLRVAIDASGQMDGLDEFQQQAVGILSSDKARRAFDLDSEHPRVRERYGFMPKYNPNDPRRCSASAFSQRMLLARRLVEAGVRLVTVDCRWWDTHVQGVDSMRNGFLPRWDQCYSALIDDLDQRGLLESTLVVGWGEFGRTPKVNKDNGRDHYPHVFSAAIAGGPVQGGRVVGASDSKGAFPKENPKSPQDVLATIYRHLGIDTHGPPITPTNSAALSPSCRSESQSTS